MLSTSEAGLRKSLKIKSRGKSPGPSRQLELRIVNIVVIITQEDSVPHMGRIVRHVAVKITLLKSVDVEANPALATTINIHLSTGK